MAKTFPDGWRALDATGAAQRELETLALLARGLPDTYTVYHALHWTNLERGFSVYGEIDFVIVNDSGDLLLIEQKSGFLEETPQGLMRKAAERSHNIPLQLARSAAMLQSRLARLPNCAEVRVETLLYCPDHLVREPLAAGIIPERIVDAARRDQLLALVRAALPESRSAADPALAQQAGQQAPQEPPQQAARQAIRQPSLQLPQVMLPQHRPARPSAAAPLSTAARVHRFLRDMIQLQPDVSALVGQARTLVTRISGGLAYWARQLEFAPFRLRVMATAGSGKTQLALAEYHGALDAGKRPLYVCFNRPLADHFASIVPDGGLACTFHTLCEQRLKARGKVPDYAQPDAFRRVIDEAAAIEVDESLRFDTVIIDEGQDFPAGWRDIVLAHAQPEARLFWLEDPMQNLYGNPPVELPGWVLMHAQTNYRSPREVVHLLAPLLENEEGTRSRIEAMAPFDSAGLEMLAYENEDGLLAQTKKGIALCLAAGFRREDIAVITFHGREHSALHGIDRMGPHALRRFIGRYDLFGRPEYSPGDILLESVYRFKGQAAPAVVLTEIDFETLDQRALRKVFVGATRAMMKLVIVAKSGALRQLDAGHQAPA